MNVVKCKNGHFFDGDAYSECPHCGESVGGKISGQNKVEKKKFWGKKEEKNSPIENIQRQNVWNSGKATTDVLEESECVKTDDSYLEKDKTLDFWQTAPSHDDKKSEQTSRIADSKPINEEKNDDVLEESIKKEFSQTNESRHIENENSLQAVVKKVSANVEGKTMSYFSAATAPNEKENVVQRPSDPVVGWLVCVGGKHFGQSFVIGAGKNSIGRNDENRIILSDDSSVSRIKHAIITYEPKKRNFYLQPGDSSGLTYLNDEYIDESKKLNVRDTIELGESKFIFVPLCDESFTWEDYMCKE